MELVTSVGEMMNLLRESLGLLQERAISPRETVVSLREAAACLGEAVLSLPLLTSCGLMVISPRFFAVKSVVSLLDCEGIIVSLEAKFPDSELEIGISFLKRRLSV